MRTVHDGGCIRPPDTKPNGSIPVGTFNGGDIVPAGTFH